VAESLYRAAAKDGTTSDELGLISFLAARGKIDEAIDCGRATAVPADKAAVASALIGGAFRNSDLTAGQLDRLESEVRVCLSQGKVSTAHAQILALTHARRGRYADAVKQLRGVGDINSVGPEVLNNLAYMMILAGEREANIMPILERGIAAVGPVAGLLDTRGMVHLAAGRTKEAVADLEQAVDQVPSAAKCLHLAMAYHCEGRSKEAAAALARSNALRADGSLVLPAERELHQKIKAALGSEHK
jgi:tetratricopeptide (TPR) repeat protein